MPAAPLPTDEAKRIAALIACNVLDTAPERRFDDLTQLAAHLCGVPIALVSLIDRDRQWFKSHYGLDATQTPRSQAICAYAILGDQPLIIADTLCDERTVDNPLVQSEPRIRFYAGVPLRPGDGDPIGTLCVIDTRPRVLTEQQTDDLQALARQVETQLELRQANNNLRQLADEANEANEAKSQFLANMSHEIRTPLSAILGYAELLNQPEDRAHGCDTTDPPFDRGELTESICRNSRHLLTLVNDVLDLSRIEANRLEIERIAMDPAREIQEAISIVASSAKEKSIELKSSLRALPEAVMCDPTRLKQIVVNLINNAIKFTEQGTVSVDADYDADGQTLTVAVTDTGIGMSPEQLDRIRQFEAFTQADSSTTRKFGGTGLGLRITHLLTRAMGGALYIESALGEGSCFTATLRCEAADSASVEAFEKTDAQHNQRALSDRPLDGLRVLLAEDGPDNQRLITHHLQVAGASVELVENGQAAVNRVLDRDGRSMPDLILMDMHMPMLDGYQATRLLRDAGCVLPIVALTASTTAADQRQTSEAGCNRHLPKPYQPCDLIDVCLAVTRNPLAA